MILYYRLKIAGTYSPFVQQTPLRHPSTLSPYRVQSTPDLASCKKQPTFPTACSHGNPTASPEGERTMRKEEEQGQGKVKGKKEVANAMASLAAKKEKTRMTKRWKREREPSFLRDWVVEAPPPLSHSPKGTMNFFLMERPRFQPCDRSLLGYGQEKTSLSLSESSSTG